MSNFEHENCEKIILNTKYVNGLLSLLLWYIKIYREHNFNLVLLDSSNCSFLMLISSVSFLHMKDLAKNTLTVISIKKIWKRYHFVIAISSYECVFRAAIYVNWISTISLLCFQGHTDWIEDIAMSKNDCWLMTASRVSDKNYQKRGKERIEK